MAFYLTSPTGTISLKRLTQFAHTRFIFLCKIIETHGDRLQLYDVVKEIETVEDSECLIEGTSKDKISHAILRLACCEDKDMSDFLLTAETLLFDFRFSCMTQEELCKVFRSTDRHRKTKESSRTETESGILRTLSKIHEQYLSWRVVVHKYLTGEGYFSVPFQSVLQLVAKREVTLCHGIAFVPFYRLRQVTTDVFRKLLAHGLKFAKSRARIDDERILELVKVLKVLFQRKFGGNTLQRSVPCSLLHTQIDELVPLFPPCMSHLHKVLRRKHRLNHHARIQYTLFLKEMGLPVHEAVIFWRTEYSKYPHETTGCGHVWSSNERRYTYSIRHLYGLEGSRINYRGHSCKALQESYCGVSDEGGCPFSHFDIEHLIELLTEEGVQNRVSEIINLKVLGNFSDACRKVHSVKMEHLLKEEYNKGTCGSAVCSQPNGKRQRLCVDIEDVALKKTSGSAIKQFEKTAIFDSTASENESKDIALDLNENKKDFYSATEGNGFKTTEMKDALIKDKRNLRDITQNSLQLIENGNSQISYMEVDRLTARVADVKCINVDNNSCVCNNTDCRSTNHNRQVLENCSCIQDRIDCNIHYSRKTPSIDSLNYSDSGKDVTCCVHSEEKFSKPIDFYMSYVKLLQNLQTANKDQSCVIFLILRH